jgi:glutamyl/glutaminyl-tRNA synthetase
MVNFLALLGWSYDGERELFTLAELEEVFRLDRVGSNPAVFNLEKLEWMNGQHLKRLAEEEKVALVRAYLGERGWNLDGHDPEWLRALVRAIGDRLKTLADAETYGAFALRETLEMDPEAWKTVIDRTGAGDHLKRLAERIAADGAFTTESLEKLTRGLAQELGIKAGELMGAARVALTGRRVAPGLFEVMWLLGKSRCVGRLEDAAARWAQETRPARA